VFLRFICVIRVPFHKKSVFIRPIRLICVPFFPPHSPIFRLTRNTINKNHYLCFWVVFNAFWKEYTQNTSIARLLTCVDKKNIIFLHFFDQKFCSYRFFFYSFALLNHKNGQLWQGKGKTSGL